MKTLNWMEKYWAFYNVHNWNPSLMPPNPVGDRGARCLDFLCARGELERLALSRSKPKSQWHFQVDNLGVLRPDKSILMPPGAVGDTPEEVINGMWTFLVTDLPDGHSLCAVNEVHEIVCRAKFDVESSEFLTTYSVSDGTLPTPPPLANPAPTVAQILEAITPIFGGGTVPVEPEILSLSAERNYTLVAQPTDTLKFGFTIPTHAAIPAKAEFAAPNHRALPEKGMPVWFNKPTRNGHGDRGLITTVDPKYFDFHIAWDDGAITSKPFQLREFGVGKRISPVPVDENGTAIPRAK